VLFGRQSETLGLVCGLAFFSLLAVGFLGWAVVGILRKHLISSQCLALTLKRIRSAHEASTGAAPARIVPLATVSSGNSLLELER
jgi:hypothetical protein